MAARESERDGPAAALVVCASVGAACLLSTAGLAFATGAAFSLWLDETEIFLLAATGYLVVLALGWDFLLILARRWRERGFFSIGWWPLPLVLTTAYVLIGTSNITLISLELLRGATAWRDPLLWRIEGPLLSWMARLPIAVTEWDVLYHSAWLIELTGLFALVVLARRPARVLHFCVSFVLLFYVGRFLGLLNPVKGPAFFEPERYGYLAGSLTADVMDQIAVVMASDPSTIAPSASLLGGVSAMPSLHVGMVALTVYWLAASHRRALWIGVPWVLSVWAATVVLGWHYVLDGAGGLLLAAGCIAATRWLLARMRVPPAPERSAARTACDRSAAVAA